MTCAFYWQFVLNYFNSQKSFIQNDE